MNVKLLFLNLRLLVSFGAQALNWQRKDVLRPLAQKPTTVLVCMMEGGKSASAINFDLQEMQKIGSNENMNVLVWAALDDDLDKSAYALVVQKGQVFQDGEILKKMVARRKQLLMHALGRTESSRLIISSLFCIIVD